jgi:hypothetical protein
MIPELKLKHETPTPGQSNYYITLVGEYMTTGSDMLLTRKCTSLAEIEAELSRLETALKHARDEARSLLGG